MKCMKNRNSRCKQLQETEEESLGMGGKRLKRGRTSAVTDS